MSTTGLKPFDCTLNATNHWLNDLMEEMDCHDRQWAYHALRAVLHALRDRLRVEEAAAFGAQLPMLIRGFYYEGWRPSGKPLRERRKEDFLAHVAAAFPKDPDIDPELVARGVFRVLARQMTPGSIDTILHILPGEIRALWTG